MISKISLNQVKGPTWCLHVPIQQGDSAHLGMAQVGQDGMNNLHLQENT
jgi:hypothetical protein